MNDHVVGIDIGEKESIATYMSPSASRLRPTEQDRKSYCIWKNITFLPASSRSGTPAAYRASFSNIADLVGLRGHSRRGISPSNSCNFERTSVVIFH